MRLRSYLHVVCFALLFSLISSFFLFPAWARGGGGGHGGGGHGGGFGGGFHSSGSGGGSANINFTVLFLLLLVLVAIAVYGILADRVHLVNVVIVLKRGNEYVNVFDRYTRNADFSTARSRTKAAQDLFSVIRLENIDDGFVRVGETASASKQNKAAKELWNTQMRAADVDAGFFNVSSDGRQNVSGTVNENTSFALTGGICVVSFVFSTHKTEALASGMNVRSALIYLSQRSVSAFYFFYTPQPGESLTNNEAETVCRTLREKNSAFVAH